jgi:hypothetical protein
MKNRHAKIAPRLAVGRFDFEDVLEIVHCLGILLLGAQDGRY